MTNENEETQDQDNKASENEEQSTAALHEQQEQQEPAESSSALNTRPRHKLRLAGQDPAPDPGDAKGKVIELHTHHSSAFKHCTVKKIERICINDGSGAMQTYSFRSRIEDLINLKKKYKDNELKLTPAERLALETWIRVRSNRLNLEPENNTQKKRNNQTDKNKFRPEF